MIRSVRDPCNTKVRDFKEIEKIARCYGLRAIFDSLYITSWLIGLLLPVN